MIYKNSLIVLNEMYHFHQFGLPRNVICVCSNEKCSESETMKDRCAVLLEDVTDGVIHSSKNGFNDSHEGIKILIGQTVFKCHNLMSFMYDNDFIERRI